MNTLRFSLQVGLTYMLYELKVDSFKSWHDPDLKRFRLYGCKLVNKKGGAMRIFTGKSNKHVVAWVEFTHYEEIDETVPHGEVIRYNPRDVPNWELNGCDVDGTEYPVLVTSGRRICLP